MKTNVQHVVHFRWTPLLTTDVPHNLPFRHMLTRCNFHSDFPPPPQTHSARSCAQNRYKKHSHRFSLENERQQTEGERERRDTNRKDTQRERERERQTDRQRQTDRSILCSMSHVNKLWTQSEGHDQQRCYVPIPRRLRRVMQHTTRSV